MRVRVKKLVSASRDQKANLLTIKVGTPKGSADLEMPMELAGDLMRQLTAIIQEIESRAGMFTAQGVVRSILASQFLAAKSEEGSHLLLTFRTADGLIYSFAIPVEDGPRLRDGIQ